MLERGSVSGMEDPCINLTQHREELETGTLGSSQQLAN